MRQKYKRITCKCGAELKSVNSFNDNDMFACLKCKVIYELKLVIIKPLNVSGTTIKIGSINSQEVT